MRCSVCENEAQISLNQILPLLKPESDDVIYKHLQSNTHWYFKYRYRGEKYYLIISWAQNNKSPV